ncbi:hypothetical protein BbiDN127_AA0042 (plasmid) [Borreliella bissettiae DN127]|uniref:Uncharacterized protein n=1 Tax=Borrelia bissettiae (strain DSM 17990 / CIP 109136 / DN127) TaxID=521010 RepID=G0AP09_BORBD|nr:hypothetical protein BbiDN127_D0033 [Borreliella bissettiae DN127]AEL19549.1 hypothetical protein BbiDN127_AA0042 [Borreliella bissettiae DN127]
MKMSCYLSDICDTICLVNAFLQAGRKKYGIGVSNKYY